METKSLLASRTFWGAILSVTGALAGLAGYTFGPEEQEALLLLGTTIATAVGSVLAIYGRVKATKGIK
jgi:hypothetical protein